MASLQEYEARIKAALDQIGYAIETGAAGASEPSSEEGTDSREELLQLRADNERLSAEIDALRSAQPSGPDPRIDELTSELDALRQERKVERAEIQALYEKLAAALAAQDSPEAE